MRFLQFILFFTAFYGLKAQCPAANFSSPSAACINQRITPTNLSSNASRYEWDFCSGDLEIDPTATAITTDFFLVRARSFRLVKSSSRWYGFSIDQANNILLRFDFGTDPGNTPTIINLGNPNGLLQTVFDFELYLESGQWYALVLNDTGNSVIKLSFGANLESVPIASTVQSLTVNPRGIAIVNDEGNLSVFITAYLSTSIIRLDFGNSINNTPQVNTFSLPSIVSLRGLSFIKQCNSWFALASDYNQGLLYLLDFSSGLVATPTSNALSTNSVFSFPASVSLQQEGGKYFAFVQSALGNVYRLSFGSTLTLGVQSTIDFGNLGVSTDNFPLAIVNNESTWLGFSVDNVAGRLIRLSFINPCAVSTSTSAAINPSVFFTTPGNYKIALKSFDALGNSSSIQKIIAISAQQAPDIDFTYQNICANNLVNFTSINASGNINSYNWDFGNSNTSSTSNPSSIYAGAGSYVASLNVSAINGCSNFAQKNIQIFNQPTAFFTLPSASPICTNQNYTFTNTTTFDAGTNPTWQWSVNDTTVAITQNLAQAFASATSKQIKLIASIPGCSSTTAQTISSIEKGPEVSFSAPSSGCQEVSIDFSSTTTGAVSSYLWDFGDGNTTNSQNPTKTFTTPGSYSVSLMATNPVGCQNSATKNLTIYSKPNPNFSIGLPPFSCSGTASQFNDLTPSPTDSNITSWSWSFGDSGSGSSAIKNPTYTFSIAGSYNVSLQVGTNFGCTDSIQKSVTIAQSPQASFSNLAACVNQGTQFTDTSTGGVKSRIWQMGFTTSTNTNPIYTFTSAGSFPVLLTVTGSNNCVSQVSKNVNVPLVPELDFSVEKPCTNSTTIFTEVTNSIDPSSAQSWAFGSLANANESPVQYSFVAAGTYLVRLNSTRKSGCVYSLSKNISVVDSPVAAFIPSIEAGPSPLGVSFTNNSVFSTSYLWDFGDSGHTTSSQPSPVFVFTELGDYKVELRASNSVGCSSKTSKVVQVVIPHVDAVMTDFYFVKDATTNALQPVVTLVNKSNVSISDPIILIDVMGGSRIKKKIISTLKPSQQITQSLDLQLVPTSGQYVCAEVQVSGDEDLFLNRRCVTLTGEEILFAPFPNPVKTELNLDWISKNASPVTFQIVNSSGGITFQQTITAVVKGINRFVINTSEFTQGIYYIQFSDHEVSKAFNFVVSGN